jgi:hypothetical protein
MQISILGPVVWVMENEINAHRAFVAPILADDTAMRRSTEYCRESMRALTSMVNDMSIQIRSQKKIRRGIVKIKVMKKQALADLESRLKQAVTLLGLAQQSYCT